MMPNFTPPSPAVPLPSDRAVDDGSVLLVLVDALRWDYPARAPFLRRLVRRSTAGRLQEPFGFTPRAAYFKGVDVEPDGYTHMFRWNPAASPFRSARFLSIAPCDDPATAAWARTAVEARARNLSPDFVRQYIGALDIPFDALPYFDVAERESPWSGSHTGENLFDRLSGHGLPTYVRAWPDTNGLSDAAIVAAALRDLRPDHRFAFLHLSTLDGAGHTAGPGSRAVQDSLEETDRLLDALIEHVQRIWRRPRVIIFGDHGMVPVLRAVDVLSPLRATGLAFGRDLGYFVDSTTVRFWFFSDVARETVRALLAEADYGHLVTDAERARFGLECASWSNGDEFFLAHPGVVFAPSFFGASAPRGMHGYDPECLDNQGAFIYWSRSDDRGRDAGVVHARQLFSTVLTACGIDLPEHAPLPVVPERCATVDFRFTVSAEPAHEALVREDLERIRAATLATLPGCEAVLLGGSFGRGEGLVRDEPSPAAVNDYDVVVVGGVRTAEFDAARAALAHECRVDALDLTWLPAGLTMGPSQLTFDLRSSATVLYGRPDPLAAWGTANPGDLTMDDAWLALSNRACGLLEVVHVEGGSTREALDIQMTKLAAAAGDALLILWADYHPALRIRATRFSSLSDAAILEPGIVQTISRAYRRKLGHQHPVILPTEALQDAVKGVSLRHIPHLPAGKPDWCTRIVGHAVEGRGRQWPVTSPVARAADRLPPATASDLMKLYEEVWRLFFALRDARAPEEWQHRRDATVLKWRTVIH